MIGVVGVHRPDHAQIVGVPLVDHVIVTPTAKYASFLELGLLAER